MNEKNIEKKETSSIVNKDKDIAEKQEIFINEELVQKMVEIEWMVEMLINTYPILRKESAGVLIDLANRLWKDHSKR